MCIGSSKRSRKSRISVRVCIEKPGSDSEADEDEDPSAFLKEPQSPSEGPLWTSLLYAVIHGGSRVNDYCPILWLLRMRILL